ncbi:MAG: hypothetical protein RR482_00545 [Clostridia bacterium]
MQAALYASLLRGNPDAHCFLRVDRTRKGLFVTDAARWSAGGRMWETCLDAQGFEVVEMRDGLLWLDLCRERQASLLEEWNAQMPLYGEMQAVWQVEQAMLASLCHLQPVCAGAWQAWMYDGLRDVLRVRTEKEFRMQCAAVRGQAAVALRRGAPAVARASGLYLADWLWTHQGVGIPGMMKIDVSPWRAG